MRIAIFYYLLIYLLRMKYSDEQLAAQFLSGDEKAFETLIERYLKPLYNFAYQMTRDKAAAEDITQEVFVKVWKKIASFDSGKKFSTWIFAIAKNEAFDWLKKKKAISFSALNHYRVQGKTFENENSENFLEFIEDENALHSEEFLRAIDSKREINNLLNSLHPQTKAILILHNIYGFSLSEVSEILGHSPNTIKSKYRRAIIFLRNQFSF
jgi:RNA polymerase sigma-70 factor (ECF subfamily)